MNTELRIACFFTGGYTELDAMKDFMCKINDNIQYIQLCPIRERKNKDQIRNRHSEAIRADQNGLTGEALINYIINFIQSKRFREEYYDAILIEDDKDDRFLSINTDGYGEINQEEWTAYKNNVTHKIHQFYPEIPVIFFYAAPEVEAWFLADFDNSFGTFYKSMLNYKENRFFQINFRKYVVNNILTEHYKLCIENYGYFNNVYHKLSSQIQESLKKIDFLKNFRERVHYNEIIYSKRYHAPEMLRNINPEKVSTRCNQYFSEGFRALKDFGN